jgi:hypothetical protein
VTVTNTTAGSVTILSLTFTGAQLADFTTSSDSCTGNVLAAHASCTAGVIFTPHGTIHEVVDINIPRPRSDPVATSWRSRRRKRRGVCSTVRSLA